MLVAAVLALTLTGCDSETPAELEKRAEYVKVCHDAGGKIQRQGVFMELDRCYFE